MVNLKTGKCFANWPTMQSPLHKVTTMDFSGDGGLFAVGNGRGRCLLYKVSGK